MEPLDREGATNGTAKAYVVREGDTLSKIAARFYGQGRDWSEIAKRNPDVDPNRLQVGQKLMIPLATEKKDVR